MAHVVSSCYVCTCVKGCVFCVSCVNGKWGDICVGICGRRVFLCHVGVEMRCCIHGMCVMYEWHMCLYHVCYGRRQKAEASAGSGSCRH